VAADVEQAATLEDCHRVGSLDGADAVGHHHGGQLGQGVAEAVPERGLGVGVERGGGVVEHEQGGLTDQGSGQRDPLTLTAGQGHAALTHPGVEPLR